MTEQGERGAGGSGCQRRANIVSAIGQSGEGEEEEREARGEGASR